MEKLLETMVDTLRTDSKNSKSSPNTLPIGKLLKNLVSITYLSTTIEKEWMKKVVLLSVIMVVDQRSEIATPIWLYFLEIIGKYLEVNEIQGTEFDP